MEVHSFTSLRTVPTPVTANVVERFLAAHRSEFSTGGGSAEDTRLALPVEIRDRLQVMVDHIRGAGEAFGAEAEAEGAAAPNKRAKTTKQKKTKRKGGEE